VVSLIASIIGAISGIGGGIIIKPALELISGHDTVVISFLSSCTVLSMAIVSLLHQRTTGGELELRRGTALAVGSVAGGGLGKYILDAAFEIWDNNLVGLIQSALLLLILIGLFLFSIKQDEMTPRNLQHRLQCMLLGGSLGLLSSFLGIGGGPMNLAVLSFFLGMNLKKAAIHSIYIILFSQTTSLFFTILHHTVPSVSPISLLNVVGGGVLGAIIGRTLAKKMKEQAVVALYHSVLVLVTAITGINLLRYL